MGEVRVHLVISGRVQGVFYRDSARKKAQSLGLAGWVRNRRDGTVEAIAQGPEESVRSFVTWCRGGPPAARVDDVRETREEPLEDFDGFDVKF